MERERELLGVLVVTLLVGAVLPLGSFSTVLAVPALLLAPGCAWVYALRRRTVWRPGSSEGIALGVALSFVGLSVGGVVLSAASIALTRTSWSLLVAALTAPAVAIAFAQARPATGAQPESLRRRASFRPGPGAVLAATLGGVIVAAAIAGAVVVTMRSDAVNREPMTELSLTVTTGSAGQRLFAAEVRNRESRAFGYSLRIFAGSGMVARFDRQLAAGAVWVQRIDDARFAGAAVRVQLFRADRPAVPYRYVRLGRDPALAPSCARLAGTAAFVTCPERRSAPKAP